MTSKSTKVKIFIESIVGAVCYFTSVSPLIYRAFGKVRPTVRILLFHRVPSRKDFKKQMAYLKKKYPIVSLKDIADGGIKHGSVAVTFDDGFKDNFINAYPVLRRLRIPATIFIAAGYVGTQSMVSWNEVREMSENGVEIGAHTVNHKVLSSIGGKEAEEEIMESKVILEKATGKEIAHFAYPKGNIEDYDARTVRLVRRGGFATASTTRRGFNSTVTDVFQLRRTPIEPDETFLGFKRKMNGYWDFLFFRDLLHRKHRNVDES